MKKVILFLFLFYSFASANAKDTVREHFYISAGVNFWNHFNINPRLEKQGLQPLGTVTPQIGIGEELTFKNSMYRLALSGFFGWGNANPVSYKLSGLSLNMSYQYNFLKLGGQRLYAGLDLDWLTAMLTLFSADNDIDFNKSLNPSHYNSGMIQLYHSALLLGPMLSTGDLFPRSGFSMNLAVAYEWNIVSGRWKSNYAQVENAPKEKAGRFKVSLLFPFL